MSGCRNSTTDWRILYLSYRMRQLLPRSVRQTAIHRKRLNLFGSRSKRHANSLILPRDIAPSNRVRSENGKHPTDDAATQDSPLGCPMYFQQAYPSGSNASQHRSLRTANSSRWSEHRPTPSKRKTGELLV